MLSGETEQNRYMYMRDQQSSTASYNGQIGVRLLLDKDVDYICMAIPGIVYSLLSEMCTSHVVIKEVASSSPKLGLSLWL